MEEVLVTTILVAEEDVIVEFSPEDTQVLWENGLTVFALIAGRIVRYEREPKGIGLARGEWITPRHFFLVAKEDPLRLTTKGIEFLRGLGFIVKP